MKKRLAILLVAFLLLAAGVVLIVPPWRVVVVGFLRGEPFHDGKPVSYWINALAEEEADEQEVFQKLLEMGPRAIPAILRELAEEADQRPQSNVEWLREKLGFEQYPRPSRRDLQLVLELIGVDGVPALVASLKDESPGVRVEAAATLKRLSWQGRRAAPALGEALKDPEPMVRREAAKALAAAGQRSAVPALVAALDDPDEEVACLAIKALGQIGPSAKSAVPALCRILREKPVRPASRVPSSLLGDPGPSAGEAAEALGNIGPVDPAVVPALIEALEDEDLVFPEAACGALARCGPEARAAVPALIRKLPGVEAIRALAAIGPDAKPAVPALSAALDDKKAAVCKEAALALWKIDRRADQAVPVLIQRPFKTGDTVFGINALEEIGPDAAPAVPILIECLVDAEFAIPALRALAAIGPGAKEATADIVAILDKDEVSASYAARALGTIGSKEALPSLRKASQSSLPATRFRAAEAIWRINHDEAAFSVLLDILKTRKQRPEIFRTLASMGADARETVPALKEVLEDDWPPNRMEAALALWKIDKQPKVILPVLIQAVQSEFPYSWTGSAFTLLGEMGPEAKEAVPALRQALASEDELVVRAAREALQKIDPSVPMPRQ